MKAAAFAIGLLRAKEDSGQHEVDRKESTGKIETGKRRIGEQVMERSGAGPLFPVVIIPEEGVRSRSGRQDFGPQLRQFSFIVERDILYCHSL